MPPVPVPTDPQLQAVCDVLGDTDAGLTGGEIGRLLQRCEIDDPEPGTTKRLRLFTALSRHQARDGAANRVLGVVETAMAPVSYVGDHERFEARRQALSEALAFAGLHLTDAGRVRAADPAETLSQAQARASRMRFELARRGAHAEVLRFCRPELVAEDYFHAVLEATKSVFDRIRTITGLGSHGAPLVEEAFGLGAGRTPPLAFNSLRTETERGEQRGLANLLKGVAGTFRNPTAHAPRIGWSIDEQEALDLLTLVSFLHRRLDAAVLTGAT